MTDNAKSIEKLKYNVVQEDMKKAFADKDNYAALLIALRFIDEALEITVAKMKEEIEFYKDLNDKGDDTIAKLATELADLKAKENK